MPPAELWRTGHQPGDTLHIGGRYIGRAVSGSIARLVADAVSRGGDPLPGAAWCAIGGHVYSHPDPDSAYGDRLLTMATPELAHQVVAAVCGGDRCAPVSPG